VATTRIEVDGHADRSGSPTYNQGLSMRRAQAVAGELVRLGVPRTAIDIKAFGDTRPLVPTAAGVREPQNRRVEIIMS
jgi:outer membrane protein OmpA-like peptidoglycan-associated protein